MRRGIPVCHFSYGGWFQGITHAIGARNCQARVHQYEQAANPGRCLDLARGFVERKVRNCRTLLRRNAVAVDRTTLDAMERLAASAAKAESVESLLGIEGAAARAYFGAFASMLKAGSLDAEDAFDFAARNRRPPKDPVNALLSLAYSVLSRDWTVALLSVGLDPFLGFYHRPRFGRAALALDMMEEFRPLVADSVALQVINNGEVRPSDFLRRGPAVALTDDGRRKFFLAYERRMAHLVRHPRFGYQVSYRRLMEVQARLFARHLSGELPEYEGFRTR
jgi:CRISPR-associated protein Cas1